MIILLDIDGVMVPVNSWKQPEFLNDGFPAFSIKAIEALKKIISETNADIVLTTSHKSKYSIEEWKDIFSLRGIRVNKIERLPENISYLSRKDEVLNWINMNVVKNDFIIIDDDKSLNDLHILLKSRLILTSSAIGLTNELAEAAIDILKKDNN